MYSVQNSVFFCVLYKSKFLLQSRVHCKGLIRVLDLVLTVTEIILNLLNNMKIHRTL